MTEDIVRVLRLVEYEGPRELVEKQVANSIQGTRMSGPNNHVRITAVTLDCLPKIIEEAQQVSAPCQLAELQQELDRANARLRDYEDQDLEMIAEAKLRDD